MKKKMMFLASLLITSGLAYGAADLDFSGTNVEWRTKVYDTSAGFFADDSEGDLLLNAKWTVNDNLALNFEIDTDDTTFASEHGDDAVSVTFIYSNLSDFEVALDIEIRNEDGTRITIDEGSDATYLKWNISEGSVLGFYPYNIGTDLGDEFETDYTAQLPGAVYEKDNWYVGLGADAAAGETIMALKAGFDFTNENQHYSIDYTGAFGAVDKYNAAVVGGAFSGGRDGIAIQQALNFQGDFKMGETLGLLIESGITFASDDFDRYLDLAYKEVDQVGFGLFAKLSNQIDKYYPYASGKYISESFLFDDDESILVAAQSLGGEGYHGGLAVVALGVDYPIHPNINLNAELEYKMASNKVYSDTDKVSTDTDMSIAFGIKGEL